MDVAVDAQGRIYVADTNNDRIQTFTAEGAFLYAWGRTGNQPGHLRAPSGLDLGASGDIYVVEFLNHRVQVFEPCGKLLRHWGREGRAPGEFYYPTKITVAPDKRIYVADTYNHRIQVFTHEGAHLASWGGSGRNDGGVLFNNPGGIAVGARGRVWVADFFNDAPKVFDADGALLEVVSGREFGLARLRRPTDVAIDGCGTAYVVDYGHDRIQRWQTVDAERSAHLGPWLSAAAVLLQFGGCLGPNPGFFIGSSVANAAIANLVQRLLDGILGP